MRKPTQLHTEGQRDVIRLRGLLGMLEDAARPRRIHRRRTKGWRMPEGAIYVGRPTEWGNPFRVHPSWGPEFCRTRAEAVADFRALMVARLAAKDSRPERWLRPLRGHDLACWCPLDQPCHADVLLELANA